VEIPEHQSSWPLYIYDSYLLEFPFEAVVPERGGIDTRVAGTGDAPDGFVFVHYEYELDYDVAWPWEEITDPWVAEQVRERYRPYNVE
jgi:hypothetical protein